MSDPRGPAAQRPRRFVVDAPLAWAIVGAAVIALIVALAILLTRPAPVEAPGSSSGVAVSVTPVPTPAASVDPAAVAFRWTTYAMDIMPVQWTEHFGFADGTEVASHAGQFSDVQARFTTSIAATDGPRHGRWAYVTDDGSTLSMHVVDASTGADVIIGQSPGIADAIRLLPDGNVVATMRQRELGADRGVWLFSANAQPRRLMPDLMRPSGSATEIDERYFLDAAPDGSAVISSRCGTEPECEVRVVHMDTGSVEDILHVAQPYGVIDRELIGSAELCAGPCSIFGISIDSGARRLIVNDEGNSLLVDGTNGLLLTAGIGTAETTIRAVDVRGGPDGTDRIAFRAGQAYTIDLWSADPPPGWILLVPNVCPNSAAERRIPLLAPLNGGGPVPIGVAIQPFSTGGECIP